MKQGWEEKEVGDVLSLEYGKPLPKEKRTPNGLYPVYGANGIKDRTNEFYVEEPSIIVGRKGSAGEINYTEDKFWPLDVTYFTKFDKTELNLDFLFHLLTLLELPKLAKGVKPGINRNDVYAIKTKIPPLDEQKRIVAKLDQCFEAIDKARVNVEKNLNNAKELFQSKLNEIFSQKGDGWVEKKLSDIGKSSMCKRIFKNETSSEGEIPFYKIGTFGKNPDAYITKTLYDEYRSKYRFPKKGDILISASGTIGRTVVYDGEPAYYQDSNIVWIDNDETQVLNRFLYHSYKVVKWGEEEGATIKRLYNSNLEKIKIRYPQSTDHQKEIINDIDNLISKTQSLESNYQQELDALDELKKSILQKAFNGEL